MANEYGSSVVSLSKQISDDEDVFISFKADMQSDISADFVAGLLHFINKMLNFKYPTNTEKLCKTKPWLY